MKELHMVLEAIRSWTAPITQPKAISSITGRPVRSTRVFDHTTRALRKREAYHKAHKAPALENSYDSAEKFESDMAVSGKEAV